MIKVERYVSINEIKDLYPYRGTRYAVSYIVPLGAIPIHGFVEAADVAEEMFQEWRQ